MVRGDFNIVQSLSENFGRYNHTQTVIDAFNLALLDCGLKDVDFFWESLYLE